MEIVNGLQHVFYIFGNVFDTLLQKLPRPEAISTTTVFKLHTYLLLIFWKLKKKKHEVELIYLWIKEVYFLERIMVLYSLCSIQGKKLVIPIFWEIGLWYETYFKVRIFLKMHKFIQVSFSTLVFIIFLNISKYLLSITPNIWLKEDQPFFFIFFFFII